MSAAGRLDAGPRVRAYGDRALMVDVPTLGEVHALAGALRAAGVPGVVDVVPAARTVLVVLDDAATSADLARAAAAVREAWSSRTAATHPGEGSVVEIPVVYDGEDLPDVAAWAGLSVADLVARHSGREYVVAFGGFMPGFAYLSEVDPAIAAPRLATPRPRVPAGSVALAGGLTAVYPRPTPGGWRLLGRTDVALFDVDRVPPALLTAGTRVRFREVDRLPGDGDGDGDGDRGCGGAGAHADGVGGPGAGAGAGAVAAEDRARRAGDAVVPAGRVTGAAQRAPTAGRVEVLATGPSTLVEDAGRPGWAAAGVGRSGAADRGAFRLLNRLLANDEDAAALEVTLGGLVLLFHDRATVALTGAAASATLDGTPVGMQALLEARAGSVLRLGLARWGARTYVGVRGGFEAPTVLGSRSFDVLAGLGPAPLQAGDRLAVAPRPARLPVVDSVPCAARPGGCAELVVREGVRHEWFSDASWRDLLSATFEVAAASNRVGLRLAGAVIERRAGDPPSEGLVAGAVQVPPDGQPVLFLRDHPVTGGYPVIAVVTAAGIDAAAQLRPGDRLRFVADRSADGASRSAPWSAPGGSGRSARAGSQGES